MKNFTFKIILILLIIFSNTFSQLKEFELKLLNKQPPPVLIPGSKNPFLYIVSDFEDLKITTSLEPNPKIKNLGSGIFICEIIEKSKSEIYFHINGYKKQTYRFNKILKDRESFWFEIKSKIVQTHYYQDSSSQELKNFELLSHIDKTPPQLLFAGSKSPYLYIKSDLIITEVKS